jgi:hypothetical protein
MYQVPKAALEFRHDAIQAGVYEQDSFVLEERYPGMSAAEHYGRVFAKWQVCTSGASNWDSFGDLESSEPRFVHQLVHYWVSPGNDTAVTLALRYISRGSEFRVAPDSVRQYVLVLRHRVKNAKDWLSKLGAVCG